MPAKILRLAALAGILIPASILTYRGHRRDLRSRRVDRLQGMLERSWVERLKRNQGAISMAEFDGIVAIDRQPGIKDVVYLNKYAEVRWAEDPSQTVSDLSRFSERHPLPNSLIDAHTAGVPFTQQTVDRDWYAVSIPLLERGTVYGLVHFQATDDGLTALIDRGETIFPPAAARPPRANFDGTNKIQQAQQLYLTGTIFFQRGEYARAREKWTTALALDPLNGDARDGLARLR